MQNFNFLEKELLDIIFKGRNQQYGAYTLRKHYPERLRNAALIMGGVLLSIVGLFLYAPADLPPLVLPEFPTENPHVLKTLEFEKPAAGQTGQMRKKLPIENPPIEIVENYKAPITKTEKIIPNVPQDIYTSPTGTEGPVTNPGFEGTGETAKGPPGGGGNEKAVAPKTKAAIAPPIVGIAEVMPAFPGGEDALIKFLEENIKYPKLAKKVDISGTVYVEFVVNTKGKISNVKILKGIGGGCDEEAVRVIKRMPNWSPGVQNGEKVNVSYQVPVTFEL